MGKKLTPRQRAVVNAAGVAVGRGVTFVVSLALVPFIVGKLGKSDYGVFQLVRSVMGYLPIVIMGVGPALSRYVTAAHARGDREGVNRYMSTGLMTFLAFAGVMLLIGSGVAYVLPAFFDLGGRAAESQWLLVLLMAAFVLNYVFGLFAAPMSANEKLAETSALWTLSDVVRAAVIFVAFSAISTQLIWLGVATLTGVVVSGLIMVASAFVVFPWLRLSWRRFDRSAVKELVSFSVFSTMGALISAIYFSTDNFLIKWLFGENDTVLIAIYSFAAQWDMWLRTALQPLIRVILPRMTILAARDQLADVRRVTLVSIRYSFMLVAPMCAFISIFGEPILAIWLGDQLTPEERRTSAGLIPIFLVPLAFALGSAPAQSVFVARAKIGVPAIGGLIGALLNLVLSVVLCVSAGWGLYGIAAGTGITFFIRAVVFVPYYLRIIIDLPIRDLLSKGAGPPLVLVVLTSLIMLGVRMFAPPANFVALVGVLLLVAIVHAIGAWWLVLLPDDKQRVRTTINRLTGRVSGP